MKKICLRKSLAVYIDKNVFVLVILVCLDDLYYLCLIVLLLHVAGVSSKHVNVKQERTNEEKVGNRISHFTLKITQHLQQIFGYYTPLNS